MVTIGELREGQMAVCLTILSTSSVVYRVYISD